MNFQTADIVERPGPWPTQHRGLVAGQDVFGRIWVIHNPKGGCVRYDLLDVFADGQEVTIVPGPALSSAQRVAAVKRAQSLLGRPYDLLNFNCDHMVTFALAGVAKSPQLQACAAIAFILAAGFALRAGN